MAIYVSDYTGEEMDEADKLVFDYFSDTPFARTIGIEWDSANPSPVLKNIDINNQTLTLDTADFDAHRLWGGIKRCVINPSTNAVTYGSNARGDGLDLTGASGNVMVEIPKFYYKFSKAGQYYRWWVSPVPRPYDGFEVHPAFVQRGGVEKDVIYIGAYESYGFLDTLFKLGSASGKVPVTGEVSYPNLPNSGRLTLQDAEDYANNIGAGWGICNPHSYSCMMLLLLIEGGSLNSQATFGNGITSKPSGELFAGELTGADSVDSNVGINGTGAGTGANGYTPIKWRGWENPWGNCYEFMVGLEMYNSDGSYRILRRDGLGTPAAVMAEGDYEIGAGVVPNSADGYINGLQGDVLGAQAFIPSANTGSSTTYMCDYFYYPRYSPSIVLFGGDWYTGPPAGVGFRNAGSAPSLSSRRLGARLEYIPQN